MWRSAIFVVIIEVCRVSGYPTGYDYCLTSIGSGTPGHGSFPGGAAPFNLRLRYQGEETSTWEEEEVYALDIVVNTAGKSFRGFAIKPVQGSNPSAYSNPAAGTLSPGTNTATARSMTDCDQSLTHTSSVQKPTSGSVYTLQWTAPAYGSGVDAVTFWAVIVECATCGFSSQLNWQLKLTVPNAYAPESASETPLPESPSETPTRTETPSISLSRSFTPSITSSGSATGPATVTSTVSISASLTMSVTPSALETPTASLSAGASPSTTNSISASTTVSISSTASSSSSASPSVSASSSQTMSATASSTQSSSMTPSITPSAIGGTYRWTYQLAQNVFVDWRLDDVNAPTTVDFRLRTVGNRWVGFARSTGNNMINRGSGNTGSGPAVIGLPGVGTVKQYLLTSQSLSGIVLSTPSTVDRGLVEYHSGSDSTHLYFSRPLAATGHISQLAIDPTVSQSFIFAVGFTNALGPHAVNGVANIQLLPDPCEASSTCNAGGVCLPDATVQDPAPCRCFAGYTGATCNACAVGFLRDGALCAAQNDSTIAASVRIRLNLNYALAGTPDSITRTTFTTTLVNDISSALGVNASRIVIDAVEPGSIIVTFSILPPPFDVTNDLTPHATTASTILAQTFAAMVTDTSSALYSGGITAALDGSLPPETSFMVAESADFSVQLHNDITFAWSVGSTDIHMLITFAGPASRWLGVCFNTRASMVGADCITYEPGATLTLQQAVLTSRSNDGIQRVPSGSSSIFSDSVTTLADSVQIRVSRPLAAGAYAGAIALNEDDVNIVFAFGDENAAVIAQHSLQNAGTGTINVYTGTFTPSSTSLRTTLRIVHGSLMFVAWGVLIPLGILIARFAKQVKPTEGPKPFWFVWHRGIQCVASVLSIGGAVVAFIAVPSGSHVSQVHHYVGIVLLALGLLQPINAVCRPANIPRSWKRSCWEVLHKSQGYVAAVGAFPVMALGLSLAGASFGLIAGVIAVGALLCVTFIALACFMRSNYERSKVISHMTHRPDEERQLEMQPTGLPNSPDDPNWRAKNVLSWRRGSKFSMSNPSMA